MGLLLSNYQLTKSILYSLIFCLSSSSAHLCHNDESTALLQFKQLFSFNCSACDCSLYSAPLTDNWKEGTDCCAWDGVTCDNTTAHVIGLDLQCNCLYGTIHPNSSLFNLVHLQYLYLSDNNFNHSQILPSFGSFTNLADLNLEYSYLSGPIQSSEEVWQGNNFSNSIFHLQKLQSLSLGGNRELTGKIPSFNGTLRHLRLLDLSETGFTGEVPNSIGQLEYLEYLDLFDCNFFGTIPTSIGNLTRLIWLNLEGNNLINGQFPSSIGHLKNLEYLFLGDCNFIGTIPTSLGNLKKLRTLALGGNNLINDQFSSSIGHLKNLEDLYLSDCNFFGTIPTSLGNLRRLITLDLSYNNFEGPIPQLFSNFSQLHSIDFSNNQLTGPIPSSLFHLVKLTSLDLSSNNLSNTVELDTFAKLEYLDSLDLSNSSLSLTTTNSTPSSFRNITTLQLSSCNINEDLNPLCNLHHLIYLNLSNNQFGGLIPTCLGNFSGSLTMLNLQSNNFSGTIPQTFGYASWLQELDISNNGLQGVLPRSLANCTKLEVLNLGHNFIEDAFPFWLENLPQLKVIVLRDNKFHGPIEQPRKRLAFTNLHIIGMSHNEFTGTLPSKFFESTHSMMMDDEDKSSLNYMHNDFYYSVTIMNKGLEMKLVNIITTLKVVDFSYNKFDGNIPISIGRLKALVVLNFSGNGFTGSIPLSLVNLTELESLDLSQNKLSGEIPQQLTSLTFLEVFDVSQNKLTGKIPRGQQFETFSNTSYEGNIGLCGLPLSKKCGSPEVAESSSLSSSDGFEWEAVLMGYGCGVVIGLVIGSCIIRRKEKWLVRIFRVKMRHQKNRSNGVRHQHGTR